MLNVYLEDIEEREQRRLVIQIAESWLNTPYHHMASVKGVGVDCAFLLREVYFEAGLIEKFDIPYYPPDWAMHRSEERFLNTVESYSRPVLKPRPGDIAVFRYGRCVSHGAIVLDWPVIIHSAVSDTGARLGVIRDSAEPIKHRLHGFYSIWGAKK